MALMSPKTLTLEELRKLDAGEIEPPRRPSPHPERVPLFGGISGLRLEVPEFRLCDGFFARDTFAHVFAPYIVAFGKPKTPHAPHPGPWVAAKGGLGFDVMIELSLAQDVRPTGFDRLNTLWWVLALVRLITTASARMPVVSDT